MNVSFPPKRFWTSKFWLSLIEQIQRSLFKVRLQRWRVTADCGSRSVGQTEFADVLKRKARWDLSTRYHLSTQNVADDNDKLSQQCWCFKTEHKIKHNVDVSVTDKQPTTSIHPKRKLSVFGIVCGKHGNSSHARRRRIVRKQTGAVPVCLNSRSTGIRTSMDR